MSEIWSLNALCRCCHSDGYFKPLNVPYTFMEELEVYADMLRDTFGLLLTPPTIEASYAICDQCISQLREATKFKKQVLECEEKFEKYCKNELLQQLEVKFEDDSCSDHEIEPLEEIPVKYEPLNEKNDCEELDAKPAENNNENGALKQKNYKSEKILPEVKKSRNFTFDKVVTDDGTTYTCKACQANYKDLKSFKLHISNRLCKTYTCTYCNKNFFLRHSLKRHEKRHTEIKDCKFCGKICKTKTELVNHLNTHTKQTVFTCDMCNKEYLHKQSIIKHMAWHNGTNKKCMCDMCGNSFNDKTNLNIHIRTVHEKLRLFTCMMCPKTFKANKSLKVHIRQHTGERPFKCDTCGKGFICNTYLNQHKMMHSTLYKGNKYRCKVCGELFNERRRYNTHLRKHVGAKPYKCIMCAKDFTCHYSLKRHIETHDGVKRFQCDICNGKFVGKAQLIRHCIKQHVPSSIVKVKLKCQLCKMAVTDMDKHMKTHTNRALKCEYCPKTYSERNALNRHIKQTHLGVSYSCTICSKTYVKRGSLISHELKAHKLEIKKEDNADVEWS